MKNLKSKILNLKSNQGFTPHHFNVIKLIKSQTSNVKNDAGFTLAELLAVLTMFVIISGIVSAIIFSTLRGTSKTKITTEISQNGGYAASVISQIIADSRNVLQINGNDLEDCTTSPTSSTLIPTPISGQTVGPPSITLKRVDGGKTVLACGKVNPSDPNDPVIISSNGASLVDSNVVSASSCVFTCTQLVSDPYSIPVVSVSFGLSQKNAQALYEKQGSANFNTSTSLRVYSP